MFARTSLFASLVIVSLAAFGCSSGSSGSGAPAGTAAPAGTGAPGATTAAAAAPAPATGKPTTAECEAMTKHIVDVALMDDDDYRKASPAERELIRKTMQAEMGNNDADVKEMVNECKKEMSRKEYNCIMAAKDMKTLDKCNVD